MIGGAPRTNLFAGTHRFDERPPPVQEQKASCVCQRTEVPADFADHADDVSWNRMERSGRAGKRHEKASQRSSESAAAGCIGGHGPVRDLRDYRRHGLGSRDRWPSRTILPFARRPRRRPEVISLEVPRAKCMECGIIESRREIWTAGDRLAAVEAIEVSASAARQGAGSARFARAHDPQLRRHRAHEERCTPRVRRRDFGELETRRARDPHPGPGRGLKPGYVCQQTDHEPCVPYAVSCRARDDSRATSYLIT